MPIPTPFDNLDAKLSEMSMQLRGARNDKLLHCLTFIQVCRVKYRQMYAISEKAWKRHKEMFKHGGAKSISSQELLESALGPVEVKMNYFGFIEELNRFGRVFKEEYRALLPKYFRIKFYRDKMVEHWDDYEEYLRVKGEGYFYTVRKLVIPYHWGAINTPPTKADAYKELSTEFNKFGVKLPALDTSMTQKQYSEEIFLNLEKIHQELNLGKPHKGLVNALFKYSFPVPIADLEEYIDKLISWLEEFVGHEGLSK